MIIAGRCLMRVYTTIITIVILLLSINVIAFSDTAFSIHNIFIESTGNNTIEAKMKASEAGMRRSLQILADRMGIQNTDFQNVYYDDLIEVFQVASTRNETQDTENYSAVVDYNYDQKGVNDLILRYAPVEADFASYDYLIIPIFKRNDIITLWSDDTLWLKKWSKIRQFLKERKILYPEEANANRLLVTPENVFTLSYRDFLKMFPEYLLRHILLVVAEYFTNPDNGQSYLRVQYITLSNSSKDTQSKDYYILDKKLEHTILKQSIDDTVQIFGNERAFIKSKTTSVDGDKDKFNLKDTETGAFVMYAEIFDTEALERFKHKLDRVKQIKTFTITQDSKDSYKILIHSTNNIEDLTYGLYLNGLSYIQDGSRYKLTEVTKGI